MTLPLTPAWLWFLIASLVATTRLTELGLSLDPALFSAVAREVAESGGWWSPRATDDLFPFFHVHPFLAIWGQAVVFKLFGASDFTARLLSVALGCGTFVYLYRLGELLGGERLGHALAAVTLFTIPFVGRLATFYLDVPLTFFLVASLYHFLRAVILKERSDAALSGAFLAAAFLTKGLAALPMIPALAAAGAIRLRKRVLRSPAFPLVIGICFAIVFAFCALQARLGSEVFWRKYLFDHVLGHTLSQGSRVGPWPFISRFVQEHPVHLVLALLGIAIAWKRREWRKPVAIGWAATAFFFVANARVGVPHLHYYHPIYPLVNLAAAAAVCAIFPRWDWGRVAKGLLVFAVAYQAAWHVIPLPMRRKPQSDYFQLRGPMAAFREEGVAALEAVGIGETDWVYREMSLWYWKLPTKLVSADAAAGRLVLVPQDATADRARLAARGYDPCLSSERYVLYARRGSSRSVCERPPFDRSLLR